MLHWYRQYSVLRSTFNPSANIHLYCSPAGSFLKQIELVNKEWSSKIKLSD